MKKIVSVLLVAAFCLSSIFAQIRVGILNGPSCIPSAYLMENIVSVEDEELTFTKYADALSLVPKLLKNEIDIGFLPVNVAAKVYNSSKKSLVCAAVVGEGNISLITKDKSITSVSDLNGKTVYVAGAGATPDYLFKYILSANGMSYDGDAKDINLEFSIPTAQLAAQLISDKIQYAVVPEPFTTIAQMNNKDIIAPVNFQKEFLNITGSENYPLTVMVVSKKFAKTNTEALNQFLNLYSEAVDYTLNNAIEIGQLCEKFELGLKSTVVANAIPYANFTFGRAIDEKDHIEDFLKIFMSNDTSSIGGNLPDEDFYY